MPPLPDVPLALEQATALPAQENDLDYVSPLSASLLGQYRERVMCYNCGMLLLRSETRWAKVGRDKTGYRAVALFPVHADKVKQMSVGTSWLLSSCAHCQNVAKATAEHLFEDFGELPPEILALHNYHEKRLLALANLYCRTYWPAPYSYLHVRGHIGLHGRTHKDFEGLIGILQVLHASLPPEPCC